MIECQKCGGYVTDRYAKVLCPDKDIVESCPECSTAQERLGVELLSVSPGGR